MSRAKPMRAAPQGPREYPEQAVKFRHYPEGWWTVTANDRLGQIVTVPLHHTQSGRECYTVQFGAFGPFERWQHRLLRSATQAEVAEQMGWTDKSTVNMLMARSAKEAAQ